MPAREADAPRAVPLHLPLRLWRTEFPQGKVSGVALFAHGDAAARLQALDVEPGDVAVIVQLGRIEVDAVAGAVGVAVGLNALDHADLLGDVVGGLAPDMRLVNVQLGQILLECFGVNLGDFPGAFARAAGAHFHLVLARVGIIGQMPHVGDVHDVQHLVAVKFQYAAQNIFKDVATQVADMGVVVDGEAASVQLDLRWSEGDERPYFSFVGIKQI